MKIDFFAVACQQTTQATRFGLCDDNDKPMEPAYVDTDDDTKWVAIVENGNADEVTFTAIDNCVEIKRTDGFNESRCDGMLMSEKTIIFVELKQRKGQNREWIAEGVAQLKNTITIFKAHHDITEYDVAKAYIANRLKPWFQSGQMLRMQQFEDETGIILRVENKITL